MNFITNNKTKILNLAAISILMFNFSVTAGAHVDDESLVGNLKGAQILIQKKLNTPPEGVALAVVQTPKGIFTMSDSAYDKYMANYLKNNSVGSLIRVGWLWVDLKYKDEGSFRSKEDIEIDPSITKIVNLADVSARENAVVWFETSSLGDFIDTNDVDNDKDRIEKFDVILNFGIKEIKIQNEKYMDPEDSENPDGSIKYKTRKKFVEEKEFPFTIGEVREFFRDIIYFDLNSIPTRRF